MRDVISVTHRQTLVTFSEVRVGWEREGRGNSWVKPIPTLAVTIGGSVCDYMYM